MRNLPLAPLRRFLTAFCAILMIGACSPAVILNAFVSGDGYQMEEGLAYGDHVRHKLDLYRPSGAEDTAPIIIFFYGGSWKSGRRQDYLFMGEAFVRQGFMVAVPDYRLFPDVRFPDFVEDGARAVRWLSDNAAKYGGDPSRMILMGHSAGAHTAALLALDERYLEEQGFSRDALIGLIGLSGPYAFDPLAYESTRDIFAGVSGPDKARPIAFADGDGIPTLLLHGGDDTTVLPINSKKLAEKINATGGSAVYQEFSGQGHIGMVLSFAAPFRSEDGAYATAVDFLNSL
jgi:acetyl esterase/lipase